MTDLTGKTAIVTGANTGIGLVTARELAAAGARVYFACRNVSKAEAAMDEVRAAVPEADIALLQIDLGSFDSVRKAAEEFLATGDSLDLLVNNAGLASAPSVTEDGFQTTWQVNHLGPFLFTLLLLDRIVESAPSRIVNVASRAHVRVLFPFSYSDVRSPGSTVFTMPEYQRSKLANVLFSYELERRLEGEYVSVYALHPGVVATDIWRRAPDIVENFAKQFMLTVEEGAATTLHCAMDPDAFDQSGLYWADCKPKRSSRLSYDEDLAADLWKRSLEWTGAPDWPR